MKLKYFLGLCLLALCFLVAPKSQAAVTVTQGDTGATVGTTATYDGTAKTLTSVNVGSFYSYYSNGYYTNIRYSTSGVPSAGNTGSTSCPTRTAVGTTKVYWALFNGSQASSTKLCSGSGNIVINKRTVGLTWNGTNTSQWYQGPNKTYSFTVSATNVISGDSVSVTANTLTTSKAGTYTVSAKSISNSNYALPSNASTSVTIKPRLIDTNFVEWTVKSKEYDGEKFRPTAKIKDDFISEKYGDKLDFTITSTSAADAGVYNCTITSTGNANYELRTPISEVVTIEPRTLTLSRDTATHEYDGNKFTPSVKATNIVDGDSVNFKVSSTSDKIPGTYTVKVSDCDNANYTLGEESSVSQTVKITPRTAKLSWGPLIALYSGTAFTPEATVTNLVSGDTCNVTVSPTASEKVGLYAVQATKLSNSCYQLPSNRTVNVEITSDATKVSGSTSTNKVVLTANTIKSGITTKLISAGKTSCKYKMTWKKVKKAKRFLIYKKNGKKWKKLKTIKVKKKKKTYSYKVSIKKKTTFKIVAQKKKKKKWKKVKVLKKTLRMSTIA